MYMDIVYKLTRAFFFQHVSVSLIVITLQKLKIKLKELISYKLGLILNKKKKNYQQSKSSYKEDTENDIALL